MQPRGEPGRAEVRIAERCDEARCIGSAQARERHAARVRFTAQALDPSCEPLVTVQRFVAIGVDHEHRSFGDVAGQVVQQLRAGVVGPLDVVHHEQQWPTPSGGLEELIHRAEQTRLPRLRKIAREQRQARKALGHGRDQGSEFGQRHRRKTAQRRRRRALERARHEVDCGQVGNRTLDFIAVRRQHWQALGLRIARELAHQPALADPRLAFDQDGVARAGREPRGQTDEQPQLVAAADKRGGFARRSARRIGRRGGRSDLRGGVERHGVQRQAIDGMHRTRRVEECASLLGGDGQRRGQPVREMPRRLPFIGLDLSDREARTTHPLGERLLGQIERLAAAAQPVAKGVRPFLHLA